MGIAREDAQPDNLASLPPVLGAEEESVLDAETAEVNPLLWGARWLVQNFARTVGTYSSATGVSQRVARLRAQAAAAQAALSQDEAFVEIASLTQRMVALRLWRVIGLVEHCLYDAAALEVRMAFDSSGANKQTGKIMVIERSWSLCLEILPSALQQEDWHPVSQKYVELSGYFSPAVRATCGTSGECIYEVLQTLPPPPQALVDIVEKEGYLVRLSETDDFGGNHRAEGFLMADRSHKWGRLSLQCLCHRMHSMASKSWPLRRQLVSSLIHSCKVLAQSGAMKRLKDAVARLITQRMRWFAEDSYLALEARVFRDGVSQHRVPGSSQPRRRAASLQRVNG